LEKHYVQFFYYIGHAPVFKDQLLMDQAFVTLATNDRYSVGALVLCTSLREVKTKHATVCMITPGVSPSMRYVFFACTEILQYRNIFVRFAYYAF